MSIIEAIIFGIVQGITEFLPISSTAHIIITEHLLGYKFPGLVFEITLHLASVLAVILFFRKEIWDIVRGFFAYFHTKSDENRVHFRFAIYLIIATFITGILGLLLQNWIEDEMKGAVAIAISLFITGLCLVIIEVFTKEGKRNEQQMTWKDSVIVGLVQSLAVFPGISRSGSTLIASLWIGLNRTTAVRFSFLLSIPVILGSSVLAIKDLQSGAGVFTMIGFWPTIIAFVSTFICSILSIIWLIRLLERSKLIYFAVYCFIVAVLVFLFLDTSAVV